MTIRSILTVLILALVATGLGCATNDDPSTDLSGSREDAITTATGGSENEKAQRETKVVTAGSKEGAATATSADVRNQEDRQISTSGHIQTLGFAGIGGAVGEVIRNDPVLATISSEVDRILAAEALTPENEARLDNLRTQMVARSTQLTEAMAATTPSFDGLKTIITFMSMENTTGADEKPLTDAAAQSKADAFIAALNALGQAASDGDAAEGDGN